MYRLSALSYVQRFPEYADCVNYVGQPSQSVTQCQGQHGLKVTCAICGWNLCFDCKNSSSLLCVKCSDESCVGCLSVPKFYGWSGVCKRCNARAKGSVPSAQDPTVPDVASSVQLSPTAQDPVIPVTPVVLPTAASVDDVVVVDDNVMNGCSGVHLMTDVCVVCGCNCCKYCRKPRKENARYVCV